MEKNQTVTRTVCHIFVVLSLVLRLLDKAFSFSVLADAAAQVWARGTATENKTTKIIEAFNNWISEAENDLHGKWIGFCSHAVRRAI